MYIQGKKSVQLNVTRKKCLHLDATQIDFLCFYYVKCIAFYQEILFLLNELVISILLDWQKPKFCFCSQLQTWLKYVVNTFNNGKSNVRRWMKWKTTISRCTRSSVLALILQFLTITYWRIIFVYCF